MSENVSIKSFEDLRDFLVKLKKNHTENWMSIVSQIKEGWETPELLNKKLSIEKAWKRVNLGIKFIDNEIWIWELPEDIVKLMFKVLFL